MKSIKIEDTKVGDFLYLVDKEDETTRYIVEIIKIRAKYKRDIKWWCLTEENKSFRLREERGECDMEKRNWEHYNIFKPNTEEISQFNKYLILKNL